MSKGSCEFFFSCLFETEVEEVVVFCEALSEDIISKFFILNTYLLILNMNIFLGLVVFFSSPPQYFTISESLLVGMRYYK